MSLDKVKCNSPNVLEEFIKKFSEEHNLCTKAVALNSFAKVYLPTVIDKPGGSTPFSSYICPQVPELFGSLTQFGKTTYIVEKEIKALNLQSAILCLESLSFFYEHFNTDEQLLLLLRITLKVLFQAYTHCQKSESLYSDNFEELTDQLAVFFQKTQDVENALTNQLDKFMSTKLDTMDILFISEELGKLCILVTSLDVVVATKLWRAFIKFVSYYSPVVQGFLNIGPILSSLLSTISCIISESKYKLLHPLEDRIDETDVKVLTFLLNLVMKINHIFKRCVNNNLRKFRNLLLELYGIFIASFEEFSLKNNLIAFISLLSSSFYSDTSFLTYIIQSTSVDCSEDLYLPHLVLLLSAFKKCSRILVFMSTEQMEHSFKEVFETLQKCKPFEKMLFVDLKFPLALFTEVSDDTNCNTTLYEEFYKDLSTFSMNIPISYFCESNMKILGLFTPDSNVSSLLLSDVWMYRLRSSSVEKVLECRSNLQSAEVESNVYLRMFSQRLNKFLPQNNKNPVLDQSDNRLACRYAIPTMFKVPSEKSINSKDLIFLLCNLNKPVLREESKLVEKADSILKLFSLLVNVAKNEDILKFSEFAKVLFGTGIYEIQIAVLTFMKAIKGKQLSKINTNFEDTIQALVLLLTEVLETSNYIVRHEALNTYLAIALSTRHPEILKNLIIQTPLLIPLIKSYFDKRPLEGYLQQKDRIRCFLTQMNRPSTVRKKITENGKHVLYLLK